MVAGLGEQSARLAGEVDSGKNYDSLDKILNIEVSPGYEQQLQLKIN